MKLTFAVLMDYLTQQGVAARMTGKHKASFSAVRRYYPGCALREAYLYCAPLDADNLPFGKVPLLLVTGDVRGDIAVPGAQGVLLCEGDPEAVFALAQDCFTHYHSWSAALDACLLRGGDLQELLTLALPVFRNPIAVDDTAFRTLAIARPPEGDFPTDYETTFTLWHGYRSPHYVRKMTENSVFIDTVTGVRGAFLHRYDFLPHRSLYCAIRVEGRVVGFLTVIGQTENFSEASVDLANRFVEALSHALSASQAQGVARIEDRVLLETLHGKPIDADILRIFMDRMGLRAEHAHYIAVVRPDRYRESDRFILTRIAGLIADRVERGHQVLDRDALVLLMDAQEAPADTLQDLLGDMTHINKMSVGASLPFRDFAALPLAYRQARSALRHAAQAPEQAPVAHYDRYLLCDILSRVTDAPERAVLLHPALPLLEAADRDKGTELLPTLEMLAWQHFDKIAVARSMHLHKNSLYYRIHQIQELTGLSIDDPQTQEHLRISFWLRKLADDGDALSAQTPSDSAASPAPPDSHPSPHSTPD